MTDSTTDGAESDGELISRLRVIEQQPLGERAAAFAALHDSLSHTLESGASSEHPHTESPRPHD